MRFLLLDLIVHAPDPVTGHQKSTRERFADVVEEAVLAEEYGFDGFAVGERHERPFLSSAPPVVLAHLAARTSRIRLFTGVTTLSLLDPVRAFEDYATLDNLSDGRLELIVGKGNGTAQRELFHVTTDDQWDRNIEGYELFRRLWDEQPVSAEPRFRPALVEAEVWPQPLQKPLRIWHGSATSRESVELAAKHGDPLFSANVTNPVEPYADLVRFYRERWVDHGHDPADALVGAGSAGWFVAPTSQEAVRAYRPIFEGQLAFFKRAGIQPVFATVEDALERSSALVGSPEQVIDKIHRYHQQLGHSVLHLTADASGLTPAQQHSRLELFQSAVAPTVRRTIPDPPALSWPDPLPPVAAPPLSTAPSQPGVPV
ncbi:MAG: putative luciferase-family oxidoreductase [Frankiales bacterium]|nr:putative luciferase-family oxidoreductase [Frankiales bacterium]